MRRASFIFSFKRVLSVLLLLAMVLGGVAYFGRALRVDDGYQKNTPFLKDQREYDLLIFGTSHAVNSVLPMELWKQTGITSYNLAIHGGSIASSYWMLRMALEYHRPQAAVMDVFLTKSNYMQTDLPMAHAAMDPFPMTKTKLQAIFDIYQDSAARAELLFPLDVYHNRWKDLDTEMLKRGFGDSQVTTEKGGESRVRVYPMGETTPLPAEDAAQEMTEGLRYLEKFIRLCQQEGIRPIITYLPYLGSEEEQRYSNAAVALAKSLGAEILDLQHMDLLDNTTDWYDDGGHTNPLGAKKITDFLGAYLQGSLPDHREDPLWQEDYEAYCASQEESMKNAEALWSKLCLLRIGEFTGIVEISPDYDMDPVTQKLLDSLGDRLMVKPLEGEGSLRLTVYSAGREVDTSAFRDHTEPEKM